MHLIVQPELVTFNRHFGAISLKFFDDYFYRTQQPQVFDERGNFLEPDHVENLVQMHLHSLKEAIFASLAQGML